MKKQQGITMVETLIGLGIIALILVFCSLALYGSRKESRDVKRVSDMEVMRSVMATIKIQFGSFKDSGCALGAVSSCRQTNLEKVLPTVINFRDPKGGPLCSQDCSDVCEYDFAAIDDANFSLMFYLEKGVGNYPDAGCYVLTAEGISKR